MFRIRKYTSIVLIVLLLTVGMTVSVAADNRVVSFSEFVQVLQNAEGEVEISLGEGFLFEDTVSIKPGLKAVIRPEQGGMQLSHGYYEGPMFYVSDGAELVLEGSKDKEFNFNGTCSEERAADNCIIADGNVTVKYANFRDFRAESGAALFLVDKDYTTGEISNISNCNFNGNAAVKGGAIYIGNSRDCEITISDFNDNRCDDSAASVYVSGRLVYGDNNRMISAAGPMNYEQTDGTFTYGSEICGTGTFEISQRRDIWGVVSWGESDKIPSEISITLTSDGEGVATQNVRCGADGYWNFFFENMPANLIYDVTGAEIEGFSFSRRGEQDVGFEILYAVAEAPEIQETVSEEYQDEITNVESEQNGELPLAEYFTDIPPESNNEVVFLEEPAEQMTIQEYIPEPEQTAEPLPEPTQAPVPEIIPVIVTKSPTGETVKEGGYAIFIARADNCIGYIWHAVSPDGSLNYTDNHIAENLPEVLIEGLGTERLKLINIPAAMNGWSVQAEFIGQGENAFSERAPLTVISDRPAEMQSVAVEPTPEPTPIPIPELTPTPTLAPVTEIIPETVMPTPTPTPLPTPVPASVSTPLPTPIPTQTPNTQSIQVVALWNDGSNYRGTRPAYTVIELYRDDVLCQTATLSNANNWTYNFTELSGGSYKVKEASVNYYTVTYTVSGSTITVMNTYTAPAISTPVPTPYTAPTIVNTPAPTYAPVPTPVPTFVPAYTSTPVPTRIPAAATPYPSQIPVPATASPSSSVRPQQITPTPSLNEIIGNSRNNGSGIWIWITILGISGTACAGIAIYLIKKMRY